MIEFVREMLEDGPVTVSQVLSAAGRPKNSRVARAEVQDAIAALELEEVGRRTRAPLYGYRVVSAQEEADRDRAAQAEHDAPAAEPEPDEVDDQIASEVEDAWAEHEAKAGTPSLVAHDRLVGILLEFDTPLWSLAELRYQLRNHHRVDVGDSDELYAARAAANQERLRRTSTLGPGAA